MEEFSNKNQREEENVIVSALLKSCGKKKDIHQTNRIYSEIVKKGFHEIFPYLRTSIINTYAKCGLLKDAQYVINNLPLRDVVSWTALISGYVQEGKGYEALKCFQQMQGEGVFPNSVTFIFILKACGSIGAIDMGKEIHAQITKEGLVQKDITIGNALVDMYANCRLFEESQLVFDKVLSPNVMAWSSLIALYTQLGENEIVCITFDRWP